MGVCLLLVCNSLGFAFGNLKNEISKVRSFDIDKMPNPAQDSAFSLIEKGQILYENATKNRNDYEYKKAIDNLNQCIAVFKKINDNHWLSKCYSLLGVINVTLGEFAQAESYHKLAVATAPDEIQKAKCLVNYAILQSNSGKDNLAIQSYKQASGYFHKNNITTFDYYLFVNTGNAYFRDNNFEGAISYYEKSLPLVDKKDLSTILIINDNIGVAQLQLGNLSKSKEILEKNLKAAEKNNILSEGTFYESLAKYYQKVGNIALANVLIDSALNSIFKKNKQGGLPLISEIRNSQKLQKAYEFLTLKNTLSLNSKNKFELLALLDQLIDLTRNSHTQTASKMFWREKMHRFYENAIAFCFKEKNYEKAFYYIEKSRAILLLDALKELDAKRFLTQHQRTQEQQLRYKMIGLQNKFALLGENDENYNPTLKDLIVSQENYQKFIEKIEATNPQFRQLKYNDTYLNLKQTQAIVKKNNQTFLSYFVGESSVYAMSISAEKVIVKEIDKTKFLSLVTNFLYLVSKPLTKSKWIDYQGVAFDLFSLVVKPFGLQKGSLIISADGFSMPFEALLTKPKGTKSDFLLHNYAISYAYSANVFFKENDTPFLASTRMLGIAPVKFQSKLRMPSLVGSNTSLSKIENAYFSGRLMTAQEATKTAFLNNLKGYEIVQLYTHGKAGNGQESPMIYFEDDVLKLSEFYGLSNSDARLVVLSACETGVGKSINGEGIQSIARGFSLIGVPSIITTLWSVNNTSTYELTEYFYSFLKAGEGKDEALQNAKKKYLESSADYTPYHWAGMVLVGDTTPISNDYWKYAVITTLCLVLFLLWVYFKKKAKS